MNTSGIAAGRRTLREFYGEEAKAFFNVANDGEANAGLSVFPFKMIKDAAAFLRNDHIESYKSPVGLEYAIGPKVGNMPVSHVSLGDGASHELNCGPGTYRCPMTLSCNEECRDGLPLFLGKPMAVERYAKRVLNVSVKF